MKTNLNNFGTHVADEICSKTIWNKCQIYSLSIATLSFKMRFNFFLCNGTLKHRTLESFRGCNRPISCFFPRLASYYLHDMSLLMSWCSIIIFTSSLTYIDGHLGQLTTLSQVSTTMIDDAFDQWRKRLHCCMETSGHHFEHLL